MLVCVNEIVHAWMVIDFDAVVVVTSTCVNGNNPNVFTQQSEAAAVLWCFSHEVFGMPYF